MTSTGVKRKGQIRPGCQPRWPDWGHQEAEGTRHWLWPHPWGWHWPPSVCPAELNMAHAVVLQVAGTMALWLSVISKAVFFLSIYLCLATLVFVAAGATLELQCGAWASWQWVLLLQLPDSVDVVHRGLVAPQHVASSHTRNWTRVSEFFTAEAPTKASLKWEMERARQVLEHLLKEGLAWLDLLGSRGDLPLMPGLLSDL